jgi:hypothetical protein
VLVTLSDRRLPVDDGLYLYGGTTLTKTSNTPDGKLDYYLPDVLTTNDYYPGGMPMPGRSLDGTTCTTTSTPTTATVHSVTFASGLAGYAAMPGGVAAAYVTGGSPAQLSVNKSSAAAGNWGVRSPWITMTQGVTYSLSYVMGYGGTGCGFFSIPGWRIVNSAGTVVAGGGSLTSPVSGSFTPAATGSYAIEFYRVDGSAGCFFTVGDVQLTTTTYTHTTNCTANSADAYPWGHNGQLKDNEIYGQGNAYSAEYWEYDARLIRRWNTDPIEYEWQSPYACFNNNPIYYADPSGLEATNGDGGPGPVDGNGNPLPGCEGDVATAKDECGVEYNYVHDGSDWVMTGPVRTYDLEGYKVNDSKAPQESSASSKEFLNDYNSVVNGHNQGWLQSIHEFTANPLKFSGNYISNVAAGLGGMINEGGYYLYGAANTLVNNRNDAYWYFNNSNYEARDLVADVPNYTPGQWGQATAIILITSTEIIVTRRLSLPQGIAVEAVAVDISAAKGGIQYTKSSLKLGQEMHNAYKVGANGIKEFRLPSGKRIDFLDVNNGIIHELKPFNPRAMKAGQKQLDMYLKEIQSPATLLKHPEFRGINWKTVLDTY